MNEFDLLDGLAQSHYQDLVGRTNGHCSGNAGTIIRAMTGDEYARFVALVAANDLGEVRALVSAVQLRVKF